MVKKFIKNKKEKKGIKESNKIKKIRKKIFKKSLKPNIDYLIKFIKQYKNPNEYTRQDQDQKMLKYMKLNPVEFIKK